MAGRCDSGVPAAVDAVARDGNPLNQIRSALTDPEELGRVFRRLVERYTKMMPYWFSAALLTVVHNALETLQHYIEDPAVPDISWAQPAMEMHRSVAWDWERSNFRRCGSIKLDVTSSDEQLQRVSTGAVWGYLCHFALAELSHHVVLLPRSDGTFGVVLPPDVERMLQLFPAAEQRTHVEQLTASYVVGARMADGDAIGLVMDSYEEPGSLAVHVGDPTAGSRSDEDLIALVEQYPIPAMKFCGTAQGKGPEVDHTRRVRTKAKRHPRHVVTAGSVPDPVVASLPSQVEGVHTPND